jgi:hypothetical protein
MDECFLDKNCEDLFSLLLVSDKTLRFNELHRAVNDLGLKMSRPTLINHLNHLLTRKMILQQKPRKQNVSYKVNYQRFQNLEQTLKTKVLLHVMENQERFKSFSIDEQTTYVTNTMTLTNLYRLKLIVQTILEPKKSYENSLQYLFINRFYNLFFTWLLQNCKDSKENVNASLNTIEHNIEHFTQILFDKIPKTSQPDKNEQHT